MTKCWQYRWYEDPGSTLVHGVSATGTRQLYFEPSVWARLVRPPARCGESVVVLARLVVTIRGGRWAITTQHYTSVDTGVGHFHRHVSINVLSKTQQNLWNIYQKLYPLTFYSPFNERNMISLKLQSRKVIKIKYFHSAHHYHDMTVLTVVIII